MTPSARAVVTGGASGIGAALVSRLRAEGFVSDPDAWDDVEPVEIACLNAGVLGGPPDPAELTLEGYRRAIGVNVDGVVLGVRHFARVMPAGGRIVCTASLAGLTSVPDDPVYALTKHAVVGFVRSVAAALGGREISINAVCPGFADTPMVSGTACQNDPSARQGAVKRSMDTEAPPIARLLTRLPARAL